MDRKFFSLPQRTDKFTVNQIHYIFSETYKELRPTLNCPIIYVEFYQFVGINHTIRLKEDKLYIRLSDLFKDAPTSLMEVLATILFSKLLNLNIPSNTRNTYRNYVSSRKIRIRSLKN